MSAEPQDWVAVAVQQQDRAERAEAERDTALEVAETAMRIMTDDQLIEMRRRLAKDQDDGDEQARTGTAG